MNRQVPIDKNESNPMLLGLMELVREDSQALQELQKELSKAMSENAEVSGIMEEQKKERTQLQQEQQKKVAEMMKESETIAQLVEQHKKEAAELQARQRQEIEKAMSEDAAIVEEMKQQKEAYNKLCVQQQQLVNKEVSVNPAFAEIVSRIKEGREAVQERQQMFDKEMFKATYLTPVKVTPEPQKDAEGNLIIAEGTQISVQVLPLKDGKGLMMAFTDNMEFKKWDKAGETHTFSMKMQDFIGAVLKDPNIAGLAINPFSANVVLPRARIEMMVKAAAAQRQAAMSKNVEMVEANINE